MNSQNDVLGWLFALIAIVGLLKAFLRAREAFWYWQHSGETRTYHPTETTVEEEVLPVETISNTYRGGK